MAKKPAETQKTTKAATPKAEAKPLTGKTGTLRSILAVVATIGVVAFIWFFLPLPNQSGPARAVATAWTAVETKDFATFEKVVDTDAFVKSLIEQVIAFEEINNADSANVKNFRQLLSQGMIGAFRNDLAATYTQQLSDLVTTGDLEKRKDGLLWKLWQQTGAHPQYFKNFEVLDQNDTDALLTLNFERPDLGGTVLSLNLLLEHDTTADSWHITGVPNLANFLFTISNRQKEQLDALNAPIQKRLNETISILDVQKAGGVGDTRNGVLWHVAYRNSSSRNIESFKAVLKISNGEGHYLGELALTDDDGLASGQTAERAWPMPLNTNNSADAEILAASPRVLQTSVTVSEVTFTNGETLKLLDELPAAEQPTKDVPTE